MTEQKRALGRRNSRRWAAAIAAAALVAGILPNAPRWEPRADPGLWLGLLFRLRGHDLRRTQCVQ